MRGVAFTIIVFLVGLFAFAFLFIILDGIRSAMFDVATSIVVNSDLSTSISIWNNVITALPFIVLIIAGIWVWTRAQKRDLGGLTRV